MPGVFISYRREDASGHAGALERGMLEHFPADEVFLDVASVHGGDPFPRIVEDFIKHADVVLVLISAHWLASNSLGRRRIDNPDDLVKARGCSQPSIKSSHCPGSG
jgi:hypothetical protein